MEGLRAHRGSYFVTAHRTFGDIVQQHPRADGKVGFTVRELCRAMPISAASLREAHTHPGRLSLSAVSTLATLMQEPLAAGAGRPAGGRGNQKEETKQVTRWAKVASAFSGEQICLLRARGPVKQLLVSV